jgi:3-hydroxyacyl-[acyl-carrier-protein] dehydratase
MNQAEANRKKLILGPEVIQLLIPHRRPLLMVDGILAYARGEQPTLWAKRMISANEDIFAGHFPDLALWPGIYTQEGMGQTCLLLQILEYFQDHWSKAGKDPEEILSALRNLEMKYRMHPGYRPENSACLQVFDAQPRGNPGMSGAVDLRFHEPVFAGQCLEFKVSKTHRMGNMVRFDVEATVEGRLVAKGNMTGVMKTPLPELPSGNAG